MIQDLQSRLHESIDLQELKQLITEYNGMQAELVATLRSWGSDLLKQSQHFTAEAVYKNKRKTVSMDYTIEQLTNIDYDKVSSYFQGLKKNSTGIAAAEYQANLEIFSKAKVRQAELRRQYPKLVDYEANSRKLVNEIKGTYDLATKIAAAENRVYQKLYKDLSKQDKGTNPCRDFKL